MHHRLLIRSKKYQHVIYLYMYLDISLNFFLHFLSEYVQIIKSLTEAKCRQTNFRPVPLNKYMYVLKVKVSDI